MQDPDGETGLCGDERLGSCMEERNVAHLAHRPPAGTLRGTAACGTVLHTEEHVRFLFQVGLSGWCLLGLFLCPESQHCWEGEPVSLQKDIRTCWIRPVNLLVQHPVLAAANKMSQGEA